MSSAVDWYGVAAVLQGVGLAALGLGAVLGALVAGEWVRVAVARSRGF